MKSAENLFLFSFFHYQHQQLVSITTSTDNCQPERSKIQPAADKESCSHFLVKKKSSSFFFKILKLKENLFDGDRHPRPKVRDNKR